MATDADIARDARRAQFALVAGFCGIVLFGGLFSQTQRALLDAVFAPPAAFAAVPKAPSSRILATDAQEDFPRPAAFAPRPASDPVKPSAVGQEVAQNFATAPSQGFAALPGPVTTPDAPGADGSAPFGAGDDSGTHATGGSGVSTGSFAPPAIGGGAATGNAGTAPTRGGGTTDPSTGTTPASGTDAGAAPGTGSAPGTGTGTSPGTGAATPPGTGTTPGTTPGTSTTPGTGTGATPGTGTTPGAGTTPGTGAPSVGAVPEPETWVMLLSGFFLVGCAVRRRRGGAAAGRAIS